MLCDFFLADFESPFFVLSVLAHFVHILFCGYSRDRFERLYYFFFALGVIAPDDKAAFKASCRVDNHIVVLFNIIFCRVKEVDLAAFFETDANYIYHLYRATLTVAHPFIIYNISILYEIAKKSNLFCTFD